ncbi:MAG: ATP-binding cassette domain-containing protein [Eubacterium sp.]|nr:ATP-binding cassette domain-containing protein [Eubacterium sp.]
MILFENVSFGFPQKDLYENISFEINQGEHAVLIGSNGCGKSSLVRLLMDKDQFTYEGKIKLDKDIRIGYVSQFVEHTPDEMTAFDFLAIPFREMLARFDAVCARMGLDGEDPEALDREYAAVMDEIEAVDGYNYEANINKALAAAGLDAIGKNSVSSVSGGEYKLLYILRSMLLKPQLLIMDEPDVFLDFENLVSLTKMINAYDGTLLAITHSRLLLSQCFDKVLDIENKGLREFPGTFAEYNKWIFETKIDIFEHCRDFDEFIAKQEQIAARIAKQAQEISNPRLGRQVNARATYLARLKKMRGDDPFLEEHHHSFRFETQAEAASQDAGLTAPAAEDRAAAGHIADAAVRADADHSAAAEDPAGAAEIPETGAIPTISMKDYSLTYDRGILSDVSFEIMPGEKVAIVGANGTGKSSLLRDLYAKLEQETPGHTGYFRQIVAENDEEVMSGGERCLAQLDRLGAEPRDIILLDEPTSHLDVHAQIALEKAIREYKGTVVLVSHDLFAVTGCTDRVLILENGTMREMSGRAYRKSVYGKYFRSDVFEAERKRINTEIRVSNLIRAQKFNEAREALNR